MRLFRFSILSSLGLVVALSVGCPSKKAEPGTEPAAKTEAPAADGQASANIAEVNGQPLSRAEFDRQFERTQTRFKQGKREIPPALETRLKENILRRLVEDELIVQKAKAEGVALTDEEFEARFAEHRKRFGSDKAYQDFLKRTGQTEEQLRAELRKSLLRERLYSKLVPELEPTDEDAKNYYDTNAKRYLEPEQVKASHILFKYKESDPPETKKAQMGKCKKILGQAKKKGADFAELAKKNSEGPSAPRGGDLGKFPRGRMVPAFEKAVFAGKKGQIIGPVVTPFGCHVIKIFDKTPERQRPFDEVKASVIATLKAIKKSERTRSLLNELRQGAKVKVLDPGLKYNVPTPPQVKPQGQAPGMQKPVAVPVPSPKMPGAKMPKPMPTAKPAAKPAPAQPAAVPNP